MTAELWALVFAAVSIGFFHTLLGPDHYLPFVGMAQARGWSLTRTTIITIACGLGHVLSSAVLGLLGVGLGIVVTRLEAVEAVRGDLAAWVLIAFGLVYAVWGLRRALRNLPHRHLTGSHHTHDHSPENHHRKSGQSKSTITPWVLFAIFVLGPCEPLIPMLMYPAARGSMTGMVLVTTAFGVTTIATMTGIVLLLSRGVKSLPFGRLERYSHALAGLVIVLCGVAIHLGL